MPSSSTVTSTVSTLEGDLSCRCDGAADSIDGNTIAVIPVAAERTRSCAHFDKECVLIVGCLIATFNQAMRQPTMSTHSLSKCAQLLVLSAATGITAIVFPSMLSAAPSHLQLKSPSSVLTVDVTVDDDGIATYID